MQYITFVDWLVIAVYLIVVTGIGLCAVVKIKGTDIYFMGERKFGAMLMIFLSFGSGSHADQAVSVAAKSYRVGVSGICDWQVDRAASRQHQWR